MRCNFLQFFKIKRPNQLERSDCIINWCSSSGRGVSFRVVSGSKAPVKERRELNDPNGLWGADLTKSPFQQLFDVIGCNLIFSFVGNVNTTVRRLLIFWKYLVNQAGNIPPPTLRTSSLHTWYHAIYVVRWGVCQNLPPCPYPWYKNTTHISRLQY